MDTVNEADWKLFKEKLPVWQENYMARINKKLVSILSDESLNAGDRFWKAEKLINREKKCTGVICEMRRNAMFMNIISLLQEKAITVEDLSEFSPELQGRIKMMFRG